MLGIYTEVGWDRGWEKGDSSELASMWYNVR